MSKKDKYIFEKYFFKHKDEIITNLKLDAHEIYLIRQTLKAENIEIQKVENAYKENNEILEILHQDLPSLKISEENYRLQKQNWENLIERQKTKINQKLEKLKLNSIEPGEIK